MNKRKNRAKTNVIQKKRRVFILVIVTLIAFTVSMFVYSKLEESRSPSWLQIDPSFNDEQRATLVQAAKDWNEKYSCGQHVKVQQFKSYIDQVLPNGGAIEIEEQAKSGIMMTDPTYNTTRLRAIVLHAMTHACKSAANVTLSQPLKYSGGEITGFNGANILVKLPDGSQPQFTYIEEAFAERNASFFKGYTVEDPQYFRLGTLARQQFPQGTDPNKYIRNGDMLGLVGSILQIPADTVSGSDIESVMTQYQDAWDSR